MWSHHHTCWASLLGFPSTGDPQLLHLSLVLPRGALNGLFGATPMGPTAWEGRGPALYRRRDETPLFRVLSHVPFCYGTAYIYCTMGSRCKGKTNERPGGQATWDKTKRVTTMNQYPPPPRGSNYSWLGPRCLIGPTIKSYLFFLPPTQAVSSPGDPNVAQCPR